MMLKILGFGSAVLALSAGSAMAQSFNFDVTGSAPGVCVMDEPELATGPVQNIRTLAGASLQIEELVDAQTLSTRAASAKVSFATVCTFPHRIVMQSDSNGLWRSQASGAGRPTGFADAVPYAAVLTWGDASDRLDADATSRGFVQSVTPIGEARIGDVTIDLTIQPGASNATANAPLLAGVYTDTLTITLEPQ